MTPRQSSYAIIAIIFIFLVLSFVFISINYQNKLQTIQTSKIETLKNRVAITEKIYHNIARMLYETQINESDIEYLMFKASHAENTLQKNKIRYELYERNLYLYSVIKKYNFRQLHYHLPSTESFLRMHKPGKYGDILGDVRKTVLETNLQKTEQSGFEEGRIFNGFRFVFPIFYRGEHVGSVEISTSVLAIIHNLKELFNYDYHFLISKEVVDKKVFKEQRSENYAESRLNPNYYIDVNAVDSSFTEKVIPYLPEHKINSKCCQAFEELLPFSRQLKNSDNRYSITGIPIVNYSNEKIGYFLQLDRDYDVFQLTHKTFVVRLIILSVIFLLLTVSTIIITKYTYSKKRLEMLENISAISVTASHEMNQPLQVMLMNLEMLEASKTVDESSRKRFGRIRESIERMQEILQKLQKIKNVVFDNYTDEEKMVDLDRSTDIDE